MLEDKSLRWAHVGSFQSCHSVMNTHSALNTLPVCDDLPWLSTSCWRQRKATRSNYSPLDSLLILAASSAQKTLPSSATQAAPTLPFIRPTTPRDSPRSDGSLESLLNYDILHFLQGKGLGRRKLPKRENWFWHYIFIRTWEATF